jgi:hypothetical protein
MILTPNKIKESRTNYLMDDFNLVVKLNPLVDTIWNYNSDIVFFRKYL